MSRKVPLSTTSPATPPWRARTSICTARAPSASQSSARMSLPSGVNHRTRMSSGRIM